MNQNSDITLVNRILAGDMSGYSTLIDRYKDMAYTIAYRIIGQHEEAEEIVQDAFLKVYKSLDHFRQKSKFSTWLYRIVYNTAISKKRLKRQQTKSLEDIHHDVADDKEAPDLIYEQDTRKVLDVALNKLTEVDRTIVTLYYLNESDIDEIHRITGLTRSNIKVRLFRSRKKLQDLMAGFSQVAYT